MVKMLLIKLGIIVSVFHLVSACIQEPENQKNRLILHLKSLPLFEQENNSVKFNGILENKLIKAKFQTVKSEEFYNALLNSDVFPSYFERDFKFGEKLGNGVKRQYGSLLLSNKKDTVLNNESSSRLIEYFHQNIVGDYHLVKRISFEGASTLLLSDNCGDKNLDDFAIVSSPNGQLLFSTTNEQRYKWDSTTFTLLRVKGCMVDTLFSENTHWFSSFSFFKNERILYVAHTSVDSVGHYIIVPVKLEIDFK